MPQSHVNAAFDFEPSTTQPAQIPAARKIAETLRAHGAISTSALWKIMTREAGGSDACGRWSPRDAYDALELAQTILVANQKPITRDNAAAWMSAFHHLALGLPTQTRRTEDQVAFQQFSTPATIAALVGLAGEVRADDTVLEPSAGTGLLAAFATHAHRLILNETCCTRNSCLASAFPQSTLMQVDGAMIDNLLGGIRPTVVLMNPPFSASSEVGRDRHTASRHLLAALRCCASGGRLVAIMPGWFTQSGHDARGYAQALDLGHLALDVTIDGRLYAKHGTSVTTRLMVYERRTGRDTIRGHAQSIEQLLAAVLELPERKPVEPESATKSVPTSIGAPTIKRASPSMFALRPRPISTPSPSTSSGPSFERIRYQTLNDAAALGEQVGIYLPYRPSRITIEGARPHPTDLVESIAMGSIMAPRPSGAPTLPTGAVDRGRLSEAQLETLIYANSAHLQDLPGMFLPENDGLTLKAGELVEAAPTHAVTAEAGPAPQPYRMGFFLGDGTGAGKGRQVAALILGQWLEGNRRHVWISKTEALIEDARRDWSALGGVPIDIQPLGRWKLGDPIDMPSGILFTTYATLRSGRADTTRLQQILDWCNGSTSQAPFEGVIAFDEAHAMANATGGQGSRGKTRASDQGIAGLKIQNLLARARIIYVSATGATDVNNLAYASRLNLWGPATAFATREAFVTGIRAGGVAAMELVARDLKAQGLYVARALSFAGVEYEPLEHQLTPEQIRDYDAYADAWSIIHQNLEAALVATNVVDAQTGSTLNAAAKGAARSVFEGTKQRFFGQLLLSAKLPSLFPSIRHDLDQGRSAVVQLVSTAEAILDRRLATLEPEDLEELAIDLSPREYMIDYLRAGFPTVQMEIYTDAEGFLRSRPMADDDGNLVINASAVAARDQLIEQLCAMPPIATALDALLEVFGTKGLAEVTGRSRRLVGHPDGRQSIERRSSQANIVETQAFMDGTKRILVFSDAGGTGRSYHASLDALNQSRRVHYLLEPGWRADAAIQGLGRTHRSAQASAPLFRPVTTDCRGERRFISTIARRLDSLGALTRGQRQTGGQNLFDPADNLESRYALHALEAWYRLLWQGKLSSVSLLDFERMTGLELTERDSGELKEELPPIQRWLNRLLALRIGVQNAIFDEFLGLIETRVAAARQAGTLDLGVETVAVERFEIRDDRVIRTDPRSGATTHLLTIDLERRIPYTTIECALTNLGSRPDARLLVNTRSQRAGILVDGRTHLDADAVAIPTYDLHRPTRREWLRQDGLDETNWRETGIEEFSATWARECDELERDFHRETVHFATGLLLPIWNKLPDAPVRVTRIVDQEGASILGREIPATALPGLATAFGLDLDTRIAPAVLVREVLTKGEPLPFVGVDLLTVKRAKVAGQCRIELTGYDQARLDWYKAQGAFTEIIQYRTRLFIPTQNAAEVLSRLTGEE